MWRLLRFYRNIWVPHSSCQVSTDGLEALPSIGRRDKGLTLFRRRRLSIVIVIVINYLWLCSWSLWFYWIICLSSLAYCSAAQLYQHTFRASWLFCSYISTNTSSECFFLISFCSRSHTHTTPALLYDLKFLSFSTIISSPSFFQENLAERCGQSSWAVFVPCDIIHLSMVG